MGKNEEKSSFSPDETEIWQKICGMYSSTSNDDIGRIVKNMKDLAKICFLSNQLVANEIKLLREDLKKD
jgi:hypothetical protein